MLPVRFGIAQQVSAAAVACALFGTQASGAAELDDCSAGAPLSTIQGNGGAIQPASASRPAASCRRGAVTDLLDYNPGVIGTTITWQDPPVKISQATKAECDGHMTDILVHERRGGAFVPMNNGRLRIRGVFFTDEAGGTHCYRPRINLERAIPGYGRPGRDYRVATYTRFENPRTIRPLRTALYVDPPESDVPLVHQLGDLQAELHFAREESRIAPEAQQLWDKRSAPGLGPALCRELELQSAVLEFSQLSLEQVGFRREPLAQAVDSLQVMARRFCDTAPESEAVALAEFQSALLGYVDGIRSSVEGHELRYRASGRLQPDVPFSLFDKTIQHDLETLARECAPDMDALIAYSMTGELAEGYSSHLEILYGGCGAGTLEPSGVARQLQGRVLGFVGGEPRVVQLGNQLNACLVRQSGEGICNNPLAAAGDQRVETDEDGTTMICVEQEDGSESCTLIDSTTECDEARDVCITKTRVCNENGCSSTVESCSGAGCKKEEEPKCPQGADGSLQCEESVLTAPPPEALICEDVPPTQRASCEAAVNAQAQNAAKAQAEADSVTASLTGEAIQGLGLVVLSGNVVAGAAVIAVGGACKSQSEQCGRAMAKISKNTQPYIPHRVPGTLMCGADFTEVGSVTGYELGLGLHPRPLLLDDRINYCMCETLREAGLGNVTSALCPDAEEQIANECLDNPLGPDDAPRPICAERFNSADGLGLEGVPARVCEQSQCAPGDKPVYLADKGKCACLDPRSLAGGGGALECKNGNVALCMDGVDPASCGCLTPGEVASDPCPKEPSTRLPSKAQWLLPDAGSAFLTRFKERDLLRVRTAGTLTEVATPFFPVGSFPTLGTAISTKVVNFKPLSVGAVDVEVFVSVPTQGVRNRRLGSCQVSGLAVGQPQDCTVDLGSAQLSGADEFNLSYAVRSPAGYTTPIGIGGFEFTGSPLPQPGVLAPPCSGGPTPDPSPVASGLVPTELWSRLAVQQGAARPVWQGAYQPLAVPRTKRVSFSREALTLSPSDLNRFVVDTNERLELFQAVRLGD